MLYRNKRAIVNITMSMPSGWSRSSSQGHQVNDVIMAMPVNSIARMATAIARFSSRTSGLNCSGLPASFLAAPLPSAETAAATT